MEAAKKILLDADVIIHFFKGGHLSLLPNIFPNDFFICDIILEHEILPGALRDILQDLIDGGSITVVELERHEKNMEILMEYAELTSAYFGKGESACMAYCKYSKDVIGSSNLKDIVSYCKKNNIEFITTLGFIKEAYVKGLLTEEECNNFVKTNLTKGSKLPFKTFTEFLRKDPNF